MRASKRSKNGRWLAPLCRGRKQRHLDQCESVTAWGRENEILDWDKIIWNVMGFIRVWPVRRAQVATLAGARLDDGSPSGAPGCNWAVLCVGRRSILGHICIWAVKKSKHEFF